MVIVEITTIVVIVTARMDFTMPLCSSLSGDKEGSVKIWFSGDICAWVAASVF